MIVRAGLAGATVTLTVLIAASSAQAATQIGQTFAPASPCGMGGATLLQSKSASSSYTAPSDGVITSWSFQPAGPPPTLKLKIARPTGGNDFTIVGESGLQTPPTGIASTFPTRISVKAGDILGFYLSAGGNCGTGGVPGFEHHVLMADPGPGATVTFTPAGVNAQLDIAALLEPDCDNDGFGDETQDGDLLACDTTPPDTTLTKHPKGKTKKKRARFEFISSEPGSTFECSLNGVPLAPCSSPATVKAKKGKNHFEVRAKDAAGNPDPVPSVDDWKFKKRKKKH